LWLELELRAFTLSHSTSSFFVKVFWDRVSPTRAGFDSEILLISAFWVQMWATIARLSGVWTQGSALAKQALCCLSHISSSFCSGYFEGGGLMNYCPWAGLKL
jgi:hypothetical protein